MPVRYRLFPLSFGCSLAYYCKGWEAEYFREEMVGVDLPQCQKCNKGLLVPLSDFGPRGASFQYKVWSCINPVCGFTIRIDKGIVLYGMKVGETKRL